jgi:hypothetical protein
MWGVMSKFNFENYIMGVDYILYWKGGCVESYWENLVLMYTDPCFMQSSVELNQISQ